ncbi:hypothetical protein BASA50_002487 [Batrachochytrium salamandrivorans]|uniref:Uncharacterized protein n=1 Tax=Batrachochytrium salamandrivorans TaxID=1357716 RepID=A0ABQ8FP88_9FUNG|nr:hypothetical protein BASA50_002487 [Batrachochytrium salamandrivorans]
MTSLDTSGILSRLSKVVSVVVKQQILSTRYRYKKLCSLDNPFPSRDPIERLFAVKALGSNEEVFNTTTALDRQVEEITSGSVSRVDIDTNIDLGANGSTEESLNGRIDTANILDAVANHPRPLQVVPAIRRRGNWGLVESNESEMPAKVNPGVLIFIYLSSSGNGTDVTDCLEHLLTCSLTNNDDSVVTESTTSSGHWDGKFLFVGERLFC